MAISPTPNYAAGQGYPAGGAPISVNGVSGSYNSSGAFVPSTPAPSTTPATPSPAPATTPAPAGSGPNAPANPGAGTVITGQDGNMYQIPAGAQPGAANPTDPNYTTAEQDLTPMSFNEVAAYWAGQSGNLIGMATDTAAAAEQAANDEYASNQSAAQAGEAASGGGGYEELSAKTARDTAMATITAQRDTAISNIKEWAAQQTTAQYENEQGIAANYTTAAQTKANNALAGLATSGISLQSLQQTNPDEYESLLAYAGGDPNALNALYAEASGAKVIAQSGSTFVFGIQGIGADGKPTMITNEVQVPNLPSGYKVSSFNQAANGTVTYLAFPTDSNGNQTVNPNLPNNGIISGIIGGGSNIPINGLSTDQQTALNSLGLNSTEQELVAGIASGSSPPPSGFGANSTQMMKVKAGLVAIGFNTTTASLDYTAMNDYMRTMNSSSQIRLKQAASSVPPMLTNVQSIFNDFVSQSPQWGITTVNSASLALAASGAYGPDAQSAANNLKQQITDITADLGTIYKGGNSATDQALQTGASQLQGTWDAETFTSALNLIQTNIGYRVQAINAVGVGGVGGTNPYASMVGVNTGTPVPSGPVSASGSSGDTSDPANLGI